MEKLFYRNPSTQLLELRDYSERLAYQAWVKTIVGENSKIELKNFAADSQLSLLRIADPVQTGLVQGYGLPATIGDKLITPLKMEKESGRFPAFGKEAFFIPSDLKRGVGGKVHRLTTQSGYVLMALDEYAEGVGVENRERNDWAGSPDMLITSKLNTVTGRVARLREKLQATLLTTYTNYASGLYASGAAKKWGTTGDPVADMLDMILAVTKSVGQRPNKAWFTPTAWRLIRTNTAVLNLIKYGGQPSQPAQITTRAMAELLELDEVLVGYATYATDTASVITDGAPKKAEATNGYIWESVKASCAGVLVTGTAGGIEPAFGYTFERKNSPIVESWYDNSTKSQIWDYEHFFTPTVTLNTAGAILYDIA